MDLKKKELGLWALHVKNQFDEGGVYSWSTVQSLANRYEYIERSDTCPTSSKAVHFCLNGVIFTQKSRFEEKKKACMI